MEKLLELQLSRSTDVILSDPDEQSFVRHPGRVLSALLRRDRLSRVGSNTFRYLSRPVRLGPWCLEPDLSLYSCWDGTSLHIRLLDCSFHGLPVLNTHDDVSLELDASIVPMEMLLRAEVNMLLRIGERSVARILPRPLLQTLAMRAMAASLARLEKRCQTRLRLGAHAWRQRRSGPSCRTEESC